MIAFMLNSGFKYPLGIQIPGRGMGSACQELPAKDSCKMNQVTQGQHGDDPDNPGLVPGVVMRKDRTDECIAYKSEEDAKREYPYVNGYLIPERRHEQEG